MDGLPAFLAELVLLRTPHEALSVARPIDASGMAAKSEEDRARTCLASTACVNSGEKATCVMDTSSNTRLKILARAVKFSRTSLETCKFCVRDAVCQIPSCALPLYDTRTISRCVIS